MLKERLAKEEKVIYDSLMHALSNHKLGHSFLLAGPNNPLKLEFANLLAATIINEKDELPSEDNDTYQKIVNNEYYDVMIYDGSEENIKKDDIEKIFNRFSKTALENKRHVYILNLIENASSKVMNMILKYMEEPNDNIYAILITDQKERLLDTIVSRCNTYYFHSPNHDVLKSLYIKDGFDDLDAYFLSHIKDTYQKVDINDQTFLLAKDMMNTTLDNYLNFRQLEAYFNLEYYTKVKDANNLKVAINIYLKLFKIYLEDSIVSSNDDVNYLKSLEVLKVNNSYALKMVVETIAKVNYSYDKKLLLDELFYNLSKRR